MINVVFWMCPPLPDCAGFGFIVTCLDLGFVEEVEKTGLD